MNTIKVLLGNRYNAIHAVLAVQFLAAILQMLSPTTSAYDQAIMYGFMFCTLVLYWLYRHYSIEIAAFAIFLIHIGALCFYQHISIVSNEAESSLIIVSVMFLMLFLSGYVVKLNTIFLFPVLEMVSMIHAHTVTDTFDLDVVIVIFILLFTSSLITGYHKKRLQVVFLAGESVLLYQNVNSLCQNVNSLRRKLVDLCRKHGSLFLEHDKLLQYVDDSINNEEPLTWFQGEITSDITETDNQLLFTITRGNDHFFAKLGKLVVVEADEDINELRQGKTVFVDGELRTERRYYRKEQSTNTIYLHVKRLVILD